MAALGSLLGAFAVLNVFLYTTLAGGLLAMGIALYHKEGIDTLRRTWHLAKGLFIFHAAPSRRRKPEGREPCRMASPSPPARSPIFDRKCSMNLLKTGLLPKISSTRGNAVVEFALVLPILLLCCLASRN